MVRRKLAIFTSVCSSWFLFLMPCSALCSFSSVALFSSAEKARLFLPYMEDKGSCTVITSATGKLIDIDVEAVKKAVKDFEPAPSFAMAK